MDPPFSSDGQPFSYTSSFPPGNAQQSGCVSEFTAMEPFHTLSSTTQECSSHLSGVTSLPTESMVPQQSLPVYNSNAYASVTSNPQHLPRSHYQLWPTPPPGLEEFENNSYHSSPILGNSRQFYGSSLISPRPWSSSESLQQAVDALQQQLPQDLYKGFESCTPISTSNYGLGGSDLSTPYMTLQRSFKNEIGGITQQQSPVAIQDCPTGTPSYMTSPSEPAAETPGLMTGTEEDSPLSGSNDSPSPQRQLEPLESEAQSERPKSEEPYAQLIYKAFMSKAEHALTLQEIYQWFRDNTDKAKSEGKGWQNSIRHNLSMNAAFVKRDRKEGLKSEANLAELPTAGESKRSTEWILEDWAVRDGVQSTTRYRQGKQTRRGNNLGSSRAFRHHSYSQGLYDGYPISTKSQYGRKTVVANKPTLRNRHYSHGPLLNPTTHQRNIPRGSYMTNHSTVATSYSNNVDNMLVSHSRLSPHPIVKQEPHQSISTYSNPGSISYNHSMPEQSLVHDSASGNIGAATIALIGVGQGQMCMGPFPCDYPYGTADVTGFAQLEHHSAGTGGKSLFDGFGYGVSGWNNQGI